MTTIARLLVPAGMIAGMSANMQPKEPMEPGDTVVIKRTNDVGKVTRVDDRNAVVELETRTGLEHEISADREELQRIEKNPEPPSVGIRP